MDVLIFIFDEDRSKMRYLIWNAKYSIQWIIKLLNTKSGVLIEDLFMIKISYKNGMGKRDRIGWQECCLKEEEKRKIIRKTFFSKNQHKNPTIVIKTTFWIEASN